MAEHPLARPPRPLAPPSDSGAESADEQLIGPDDKSPDDPVAKSVTRGCLRIWLIVGAVVGIPSLLYWFFVAT